MLVCEALLLEGNLLALRVKPSEGLLHFLLHIGVLRYQLAGQEVLSAVFCLQSDLKGLKMAFLHG